MSGEGGAEDAAQKKNRSARGKEGSGVESREIWEVGANSASHVLEKARR